MDVDVDTDEMSDEAGDNKSDDVDGDDNSGGRTDTVKGVRRGTSGGGVG